MYKRQLIKLERNINYRETRYIIYACYQFILLETCYFFEKYVGEMIESHFADNKEEIVDIEFLNCIIEKLKVESIKDELGYDITQLNWYQQLVASLHIFEKYNNERLYICLLYTSNEWLIKGSSIHDNPYRAKVIQGRMGNIPPFMEFCGLLDGDEVESFGQEKKLKVYFPFGNAGIADSGFYENPKYLRSYGYTPVSYTHLLLGVWRLQLFRA